MAQNTTRILINGRKYRVRVYEVGQRFAHAAVCEIDGVKYESRDVPFGFTHAAVESLLTQVQRKHPAAAVV